MVYVFGLNLPLLELLLVFSIGVLIYLVLLEFQFRKIMKIIKKLDKEEREIEGERKELEEETNKLQKLVSKLSRKKRRKRKA